MIQADHWGVFDYEGIKFYLEPDSKLGFLCPFKKPQRKLECPHHGLNEQTTVNWKKTLFIPDESLTVKKLQELIPEGLIVKPNLTFCHAAYLPNKQKLIQLLSMTNALPLMIYGLSLNMDFEKVFTVGRASMCRPVYISGSPNIPVPLDYKEENYDD